MTSRNVITMEAPIKAKANSLLRQPPDFTMSLTPVSVAVLDEIVGSGALKEIFFDIGKLLEMPNESGWISGLFFCCAPLTI